MKRRNQMKKMAIPTPSSREVDMTYNVTTTLVFPESNARELDA